MALVNQEKYVISIEQGQDGAVARKRNLIRYAMMDCISYKISPHPPLSHPPFVEMTLGSSYIELTLN
jgi:hypothetical protein